MQIKPFYRLRPADLPLVESPFLASQTLRRTLSDPLSSHSSLILDDIPGVLPGIPREAIHQYLTSRVATGELCLVHAGIGSDRPMSPVESEFNGGQPQENTDHRLTLPLGASASVLPLATGSENPASEDEPEGVHLVAGLFTDGTLNNVDNIEIFRKRLMVECVEPIKADPSRLEECRSRLAMRLGESYANGPTNVVKLFDLYREGELKNGSGRVITIKAYEPGAGTKSGEDDSLVGMATGLGETGVPEQVSRLFGKFAREMIRASGPNEIKSLTVDLFGFSRGGAAARHASNEILRGEDGALGKALAQQDISWPSDVKIRFLGLFDTVAGIVNLSNLDLSAGNDRNSPLELYLDPAKVEQVVQLVAADEKRANFALNSVRSSDGELPANFREITLPGAHSDVGGGYLDLQTEEVLLYPTLTIRGGQTRWPRQTMEWDNLESLRNTVESENWIGSHSLLLPDGSPPTLVLEERKDEHPLPDGRVELSLRMTRQIKGEFSRIGFRLMHELASESGVPLDEVDETDSTMSLPDELVPIFKKLHDQVVSGHGEPILRPETLAMLKQRYIHHSDHYNLVEWLMADDIAALEIPAQEWIHPLRPAAQRERVVHFNRRYG